MEQVIGQVSQIPKGEGRVFRLGELRIAVFHTRDGLVYATQAECPHKGGPLADGLTDSISVVCPLHDRAYDLRTGRGIATECNIRVFAARVVTDGAIMVSTEPATAELASPS